ncbi:MAG: DUF1517 domain-containing protein [Pseudanabaenaceae cyanobacterium SKYGB_i_bin29]|nr:DUF1517 domain-containing protein [Pseudanabaenaceae cyanobacterium SKYG29]MDW8421154.1 DUF1517 domain-containing protein [Pseudanabaenaceae cyanobacterium SKYGB_i_bin29]
MNKSLSLSLLLSFFLLQASPALSRSSGGRSRGGSFRGGRSSSRARSSAPTTRRSNQSSSSSENRYRSNRSTSSYRKQTGSSIRDQRSYTPTAPLPTESACEESAINQTTDQPNCQRQQIQPTHTYSPSGSIYNQYSPSGGSYNQSFPFVVVGIFSAVVIVCLLALLAVQKQSRALDSDERLLPREIRNNTVTVSILQIAIYAIARSVQREIRQLSDMADFDTREGLREFLREVVIVLQRNSDAWAYALGQSEVADRERAERGFEALSDRERIKFSIETYSRVGKKRRLKDNYMNNSDEGVPEFIVITLLVGTEHDKPLFPKVKTRAQVQAALNAFLSIPLDYLLAVEVLWTPASEQDSLTKDDLLADYSDLVLL